ncbi:hypothetical protein [Paenibacillus sp. IITD108]|uniref:hypothetical protein n=1 Tax=Paenibacillus sp. IITD108 TaxID=3116649 RepID=UPI002F3E946B
MKPLLIGVMILALLLVSYIVGPWLLLYIGLSSTEDPPKPFYTYGEFPFYLEYEINGQVIIVEDTVIVKYDGFGLSEGSGGKYIQWKQTLASGNEEVVIFKGDKGEESLKLLSTVRRENYHLEDELSNLDTITPSVIKEVGAMTSLKPISDDELLTEYKIRMIKFEFGDPLKK